MTASLIATDHPLAWIIGVSLIGGTLSVMMAALFALNAQRRTVPLLVSYAIGALLGAVFLEILPHALETASTPLAITSTVLFGILLFFSLEKLVLWRHCHGDHCEAHAMHDEAHCPDKVPASSGHTKAVKFNVAKQTDAMKAVKALSAEHTHDHHDHGRSGMMIMIGDTFHNFVDGILIAAAFMVDTQVGLVTALAIISHEIPQEVGDFLILLHSGFSKQKALLFNLSSSFATVLGGVIAYYALHIVQHWIPFILSLAASSMLYVAVADLIPGLHKKTEMRDTVAQLLLILLGVATIATTKFWLEG